MSIDVNSELADFHRFVGERLRDGGTKLSPEEALDLWRAANPEPNDYADSVAALREAVSDMQAGDTDISFEEFEQEFLRRRKLSRPA